MSRTITMLAALALLLAGTGRAGAEAIITFSQQGNNVVATGSGSINTSALTLLGSDIFAAQVWASAGLVRTQSGSNALDYQGFSGPSSFGPGGQFPASSATGDTFGIAMSQGFHSPELNVPINYASGSPLASSTTWNNTTFSGLGLTPGTYKWTWGSVANGNADDLIVQIGPAASGVPEPATLTLLGLGAVGMMGYCWRRRRQQAA